MFGRGLTASGSQRGPSAWAAKAKAVLGHGGDRLVLVAHKAADRFDLVPPEFGRESPIDESDARSVRQEWWRYLRLWSAYNPEEVFALKVGGVLLATAVVALWLAIGLVL